MTVLRPTLDLILGPAAIYLTDAATTVRTGPGFGLDDQLRVQVDNLFGREYNTAVAINAFGGRYFEPGPGRAFFLGARVGVGGW